MGSPPNRGSIRPQRIATRLSHTARPVLEPSSDGQCATDPPPLSDDLPDAEGGMPAARKVRKRVGIRSAVGVGLPDDRADAGRQPIVDHGRGCESSRLQPWVFLLTPSRS